MHVGALGQQPDGAHVVDDAVLHGDGRTFRARRIDLQANRAVPQDGVPERASGRPVDPDASAEDAGLGHADFGLNQRVVLDAPLPGDIRVFRFQSVPFEDDRVAQLPVHIQGAPAHIQAATSMDMDIGSRLDGQVAPRGHADHAINDVRFLRRPQGIAIEGADAACRPVEERVLTPGEQLDVLTESVDGDPNPILDDERQVVVILRVDGHLHEHVEGITFVELKVTDRGSRQAVHIDAEGAVLPVLQGDVLEQDPARAVVDDAESLAGTADRAEHRVEQNRVLAEGHTGVRPQVQLVPIAAPERQGHEGNRDADPGAMQGDHGVGRLHHAGCEAKACGHVGIPCVPWKRTRP